MTLFGRNKDNEEGQDSCPLLAGGADLERVIRESERVWVLFYANWCPFSRMFLPSFLAQAAKGEPCYRRILADEETGLADKYGIEVYPSVLYFEKGKVVKRLDGMYHVGLTKGQLEEFVLSCSR
jgi:thioredoxin-like negative regulator of GroEL